jgi:hypothetical protein
MAQSFGVFKTQEVLEDSSIVSYLHDAPTLEKSKTIWKMTRDAFAVSTDGGKTWNAGLDASGNVLVNVLSTIGIEASWINVQNLNALSSNIGGWKINQNAIYKDTVDPNNSNNVYRVYFQPPISTNLEKTWILSCQKSTDAGKTFKGTFVLYSDGTAKLGDNFTLNSDGVRLYDSSGNVIGRIIYSNGKAYLQLMDSDGQVNITPTDILFLDSDNSLTGYISKLSDGTTTASFDVLRMTTGATGSFKTADNKTVVVKSGLITEIT